MHYRQRLLQGKDVLGCRIVTLLPSGTPKPESSCKHCGKQFIQVEKRKARVFCCKACRQKWWNTHLFLVDPTSKSLYPFTCTTCKKPFTAYGNPKRKYCSHQLYIKARYHKEASDGQ